MPATWTGIDGCPSGWVAAHLVDHELSWGAATIAEFGSLVHGTTAVDMPIGLLDVDWRECDLEAARILGSARSRVFRTPPRNVLELGLDAPNDQVQRESRRLTGQGVSRQALGLASRILVVDSYIADHPKAKIREVHPELSFYALSGRILDSKKSTRGVAQRIAVLSTWRPTVVNDLQAAPDGVPIDDCLDALACLWSAIRITTGECMVVPVGATRAPWISC